MRLLDTDILVDIFRGYRPAVRWLRSLDTAAIGIPGLVIMELMLGCRTTRRLQEVQRHLAPYQIYWPTARDCDRALASFGKQHLSNKLGIIDALIGECAVGLGVPLCTCNVRHFRAVAHLTTEQPYERV
jgi:predicted nucleic acid-binding protein